MSKLRDALKTELDSDDPPAAKKRKIGRLRALAVRQQWASHPGRAQDGSLTVGSIRITDIRTDTLDDGTTVALDVFVADTPDPHFRIINPPSLVRDGGGDIQIGGAWFREDPIAAVAAVIERAAGQMKPATIGGRK